MNSALIEVGVSTAATATVATAINAEPLITALIGFGISVVTVVGGELIKLAVAWIKNQRKKLGDNIEEKEDKKE